MISVAISWSSYEPTPTQLLTNTKKKSNIIVQNYHLTEIINGLAQGRVELVVNDDGTLGYKLDGADTVTPFSRYREEAQTASTVIRGKWQSGSVLVTFTSIKKVIALKSYNITGYGMQSGGYTFNENTCTFGLQSTIGYDEGVANITVTLTVIGEV